MPTFDYQCISCGHTFEELTLSSQSEPESCPKCSSDIKKVIRGFPGVVYRGEGFPTNDMKITKDCRIMAERK
jgi:putative FmdB family regulatory protein